MKRYIFKYIAEPTRNGFIERPIAHIYVNISKNEWQLYRVYIDSGADISLFRRNDAELLGLSLNQGEYHPIMGIGKMLIPAYTHTIRMRIGETILDVKAAFADSNEVPRLLGRTDVFPHFKITFCEQDLQIIFETTTEIENT